MSTLRRLGWIVFSVWLTSFVHIKVCWAVPRNVTVDDTRGDQLTGLLPLYTPPDMGWQSCNETSCANIGGETLDFSQIVDGTFTFGIWDPSDIESEGAGYIVDIPFNGTAIYLYCILANNIPGVTTFMNASFSLDNEVVGSYVHEPGNYVAFNYSVLVYANSSIPDGLHYMSMTTAGDPLANTRNSSIIFDYALYTTNEADTTTSSSTTSVSATSQQYATGSTLSAASSSSSFVPVGMSTSTRVNTGAIAGGVVGGFLGLLLLLVLLLLLYRKRRISKQGVMPFVMKEPMTSIPVSPTSTVPRPFILPPSDGMNRPPISRDISSDTASTTLPPSTSDLISAAGEIPAKGFHAVIGSGPRLLPLPLQFSHPETRGETSSGNSAPLPSTRANESDIRQQLMALQTQVERLQAERAQEQVNPSSPTMTEPPPNYEDIHRSS